ncbi:TPA: hypothetical protein QEF96_000143 [Stenotrophomonas maltophilia]|uniref:hypothetical protein n=1 Tax=Stenotrophomonas maltophilia TaxID=40324 RepID=UPI00112FE181|nr:hypothetical protein [Stenotrophomonas maltophilia]MPS43325.1 hypothetical protein [Stenotrophomonas sp.]MCI1148469.1 hypothetical protein [Stenotrophomonas maltophilia]QPX92221.1 hypothetical protein HUZ96_04830 [Stenotrophomonas maltophilia]HDS1221488.1 hypothetical protein [Stenotrophomonas maltophilia]HEL3817698.1 hypothetical protein [Stenotrophomonas maltophilia]
MTRAAGPLSDGSDPAVAVAGRAQRRSISFRIAANAACQAALLIAQLPDFPSIWSSIVHSD